MEISNDFGLHILCIFAFGEKLASRKCTFAKGFNVMHAFFP